MKNISLTLKDIFDLPTAEIFNPDNFKKIHAVTIDSRKVPAQSLFVAIEGEKFDGHNFVNDAVKNGAIAIVINESKISSFDEINVPLICVENTTTALGDIAKAWRNKLRTKIIGITGSAGKTSTKEMLASILSEKFSVNKTVLNNNNHIGVPLTIFSTNNSHDFLVAELGTNHFGEIKYTADIASPDYALITNIGSSHLEYLKNKKGVLKEKKALFESTISNKGFLFINNDDVLLKNEDEDYSKRITFGFNDEPDCKGEIKNYSDDGKPVINIKYKNKKLATVFPLYGEQNAKNFLSAAAVAFKVGLGKEEILSALKKIKSVDKRLNVKKYSDFILIDDTYNANPESMKYSISLLPKIKSFKKKVVILGDMFELGDEEIKLHRGLAAFIKRNKIDEIFLLGKRMKYLCTELAKQKIDSIHFESREELKLFIGKKNFQDSVVLIKGSRGMKMEEFVNVIELKYKS